MTTRRWTIARRLVLSLVALISLVWLAGVVVAALSVRHEVDEVFDSGLRDTAERLLPLVLDDMDEHDEQDDEHRQLSAPVSEEDHAEHLSYQVRNAQGKVVLRSHDAPAAPFAVPLRRGSYEQDGQRFYTAVSPGDDVYVQVAERPEGRDEAIRAMSLGLAAPLLGILPLVALVIFLTVKQATRPILAVQRQIGMRGSENLDPIDARGLPGELTPIIYDMNRLLERLKATLDAERSFAANSAHELRTPLAAARAQAEIVANELRDAPGHARAVQQVELLNELGRRIEKMLQLARAEAGLGLGRPDTDLVAVARLLFDDYARRPQLGARLSFDSGPSPDAIVAVDPDALGIALQNLIDNALLHGAPAGKVEIAVGAEPSIRVINAGPPLDPHLLSKLTGRFVRAAPTRTPGAGLGLAIVEEIMRQAGGTLELFSPARGRSDGFEAVLHFRSKPGAGGG